MYAYPLNLILAVATASASILIGFLPTKTIPSSFFARESAKFILAWALIALISPSQIVHYTLIFGFLCFAAWWHFRRDNAFTAKMWLSMASGLGISVGVMLILAVTPQALHPPLSLLNEILLLASIYLGGSIIGLAYVPYVLTQSTGGETAKKFVRHYVNLLFGASLLRACVMLGSFSLPGLRPTAFSSLGLPARLLAEAGISQEMLRIYLMLSVLLLALVILLIPALAFLARRATGFSSRIQPTRFLVAIIFTEFMTEILARLLVL